MAAAGNWNNTKKKLALLLSYGHGLDFQGPMWDRPLGCAQFLKVLV